MRMKYLTRLLISKKAAFRNLMKSEVVCIVTVSVTSVSVFIS